jgi:hypothetical protein
MRIFKSLTVDDEVKIIEDIYDIDGKILVKQIYSA